MESVKISTEYIKLEQMLKYSGIAGSGSDAKMLIVQGLIKVNGNVEHQRGKKLRCGDIIEFDGKNYNIESN